MQLISNKGTNLYPIYHFQGKDGDLTIDFYRIGNVVNVLCRGIRYFANSNGNLAFKIPNGFNPTFSNIRSYFTNKSYGDI